MSKAHPNKSSEYKMKIKKREERTHERAILTEAKLVFTKLHPGKDYKENRHRLAAYKDKIREAMNQEATDVLQEITKASEKVLKNISD